MFDKSQPPFTKVLVANRGEIACRVIRALHEMGIEAVAVASEADAYAKHVRMADDFRIIGPAPSAQSYLRIDRIIEVAKETGAQAIHPGYGFLSESELMRDACDAADLTFIGPSAAAMYAMGNKTRAREKMKAAGVPIVPGATSASATAEDGLEVATAIGFPVLLKAAAGGGGKGMRLVTEQADFLGAFESCAREALNSFGDGDVYVERAILEPRHIEIQIMADSHGNAIHVFERECSVQRRHQKVIEEAPAANLSEQTRQRMGDVAVAAAKAIDYEGAGTCEFLVDRDENFYFLEMNTRLQVEHPVTEMISGLDLVKLQVLVAAGGELPITQEQLVRRGHSIECRLYAEDPYANFMPAPGPLIVYRPPGGPGVRVDDGVDEGDVVTPHYDPMVAKLITWADDRPSCIRRMRAALAELRLAGFRNNVTFLDQVLQTEAFCEGRYSTDLIANMGTLTEPEAPSEELDLLAAAAAVITSRERVVQTAPSQQTASPWGRPWEEWS